MFISAKASWVCVLGALLLNGCVSVQIAPISDWQPYSGLPPVESLQRSNAGVVDQASKKVATLVLSKNVEKSLNQLNQCRKLVAEKGISDFLTRVMSGKDPRQSAQAFSIAEAFLYSSGNDLKKVFKDVHVAESLAQAMSSADDTTIITFYDLTVGDSSCLVNDVNGDAFPKYGLFTQRVLFLTSNLERICAFETQADWVKLASTWTFKSMENIERDFVDKASKGFETSLAPCISN